MLKSSYDGQASRLCERGVLVCTYWPLGLELCEDLFFRSRHILEFLAKLVNLLHGNELAVRTS